MPLPDGAGEGTKLQLKSLHFGGWARACAAAVSIRLAGAAMLGASALFTSATSTSAYAANTLEARKLPMDFTWHAPGAGVCDPDCGAWINAIGVITSDTPAKFEAFIKSYNTAGVTIVLDSSGGSVLESITLGRRWRALGLKTSVGIVIERASIGGGVERDIMPDAYCESMCAFLLLSGTTRSVPAEAHVRVHQIWMGDRAEDAKAASYSAQDLMIVERDIGRLAKYTFDMGGSGDLLALALSVPPWEALHELTADELRLTNLIPDNDVAAVASNADAAKPIQDRFIGTTASSDVLPSTKTAQAEPPTGGAAIPERK